MIMGLLALFWSLYEGFSVLNLQKKKYIQKGDRGLYDTDITLIHSDS